MNESCHTYEWVMSHTYERVTVTHHQQTRETAQVPMQVRRWVMSHIWMNHFTHTNEVCQSYIYGWVMSHIWMSHVTHIWTSRGHTPSTDSSDSTGAHAGEATSRSRASPLIHELRSTANAMSTSLYCSVLQCVVVCCTVLHYSRASPLIHELRSTADAVFKSLCCSVLQCVAVWCNVLQCGAVCCSVLRCVAVCCDESLNRVNVRVCCSVLQYVAVCCSVL